MRILIIGNGFDLEHQLPTKYIDFLKQIKDFNEKKLISKDLQMKESEFTFLTLLEDNKLKDEFDEIISANAWVSYFIKLFEQDELNGTTWIDFEHEISNVVIFFEKQFLENSIIKIVKEDINLHCLIHTFNSAKGLVEVDFEKESTMRVELSNFLLTEFIEFLYQELRRFTRSFEIYCICCVNSPNAEFSKTNKIKELAKEIKNLSQKVNRLQYEINSPPTENTKTQKNKINSVNYIDSTKHREYSINKEYLEKKQNEYNNLCIIKEQNIDCVLSFNYTNTYEVLYGTDNIKYCYIHGFSQLDKNKTNMILGIDDILNRENTSSVFAFVKFKKYFQRILLKTGSEYRDWIKTIKNTNGNHDIFIVGHSMGRTDHEILREFFALAQNKVKINVYYHDKASEVNLIKRAIEIISKETLINQVHGIERTIRFIDQYDENDGFFRKRE